MVALRIFVDVIHLPQAIRHKFNSSMNVKHTIKLISRCIGRKDSVQHKQLRQLALWGTSKADDWKHAVSEAEKIVGYPTSFMSLRCLLSDELANVALQIRKLVGTKHPLLKTARGFLDNGQHSLQTRGLIVLLMAKCAGAGSMDEREMVSGIYPSQRSLAEITEMIHTAKLVHRGVVNLETLPSDDPSYHDMEFGNKIAVLSGDFLLANASTGLADLHNTQVVEMISQAIGDMMEAEFTELRDDDGNCRLPANPTFSQWETQTYLQTGSLLSKSCESALLLADHDESLQQAAAKFGENIAYAKQLNEDLKPFLTVYPNTNKVLTSAPVIKHAEMDGSTSIPRDSAQIIQLLQKSPALAYCVEKSRSYGQTATSALDVFPASDAKVALLNIVNATTVPELPNT